MPQCSNPVQCQMARRVECTCECLGANHAVLRLAMENPDTKAEAEQQLDNLKVEQANLKKEKKLARRKARAVEAGRASREEAIGDDMPDDREAYYNEQAERMP